MTKDVIIGAVVLVLAALGIFYFAGMQPPPADEPVSNEEDMAVRQVVTEFGEKLKDVSLLAPADARKASMDAAYAPYLSPELLGEWEGGSPDALGRKTSSPWPDRIEIIEVRAEGERYVALGNVIEVANSDEGEAPAAVYSVTLTLEERDGRWLIVDAAKGPYSELPERQAIVGYWECLPPNPNWTGPITEECSLGIAAEQSGGHYAVDTTLMSRMPGPDEFTTGTKVRVTGIVTSVEELSSMQKYDIDGVISATEIENL